MNKIINLLMCFLISLIPIMPIYPTLVKVFLIFTLPCEVKKPLIEQIILL